MLGVTCFRRNFAVSHTGTCLFLDTYRYIIWCWIDPKEGVGLTFAGPAQTKINPRTSKIDSLLLHTDFFFGVAIVAHGPRGNLVVTYQQNDNKLYIGDVVWPKFRHENEICSLAMHSIAIVFYIK